MQQRVGRKIVEVQPQNRTSSDFQFPGPGEQVGRIQPVAAFLDDVPVDFEIDHDRTGALQAGVVRRPVAVVDPSGQLPSGGGQGGHGVLDLTGRHQQIDVVHAAEVEVDTVAMDDVHPLEHHRFHAGDRQGVDRLFRLGQQEDVVHAALVPGCGQIVPEPVRDQVEAVRRFQAPMEQRLDIALQGQAAEDVRIRLPLPVQIGGMVPALRQERKHQPGFVMIADNRFLPESAGA